jgi:hypothetical protein
MSDIETRPYLRVTSKGEPFKIIIDLPVDSVDVVIYHKRLNRCEWRAIGLCEVTGYESPHNDVPLYTEYTGLPDSCPKCNLPIVLLS